MLFNVAIAILMMMATAVHAAGMMLAIELVDSKPGTLRTQARSQRIYGTSCLAIIMFCFSLFQVPLWAIPYLASRLLKSFEEAVQFSMVTYTTLGYGDVVIDKRWLLLTSFEAANGIIMFGWTTTIVMAVIKKVYYEKIHVNFRNHKGAGSRFFMYKKINTIKTEFK